MDGQKDGRPSSAMGSEGEALDEDDEDDDEEGGADTEEQSGNESEMNELEEEEGSENEEEEREEEEEENTDYLTDSNKENETDGQLTNIIVTGNYIQQLPQYTVRVESYNNLAGAVQQLLNNFGRA
nr:regulator of nonsense transcripts 2-like [Oncorhynchus nerka]